MHTLISRNISLKCHAHSHTQHVQNIPVKTNFTTKQAITKQQTLLEESIMVQTKFVMCINSNTARQSRGGQTDVKANRVATLVTEITINSHTFCITYFSALQQQQQVILKTLPLAFSNICQKSLQVQCCKILINIYIYVSKQDHFLVRKY